MNLTLVSDVAVDGEPLSLEDARGYLRQPPDEDNPDILRLISAAREVAETYSGRQQARKQWDLALDVWPLQPGLLTWPHAALYADPLTLQFRVGPSFIELLDPLVTVDLVTYKKADGSVVTMAPNVDYVVDARKHPGGICPAPGKTWPTDSLWPSSAITIRFTAGPLPDYVPSSIKQGIALLVSQWFDNRVPYEGLKAAAEIPFNVEALLTHKALWRF